MATDKIVELLLAERRRIDAALFALGSSVDADGKPKRMGRKYTATQRKEQSRKVKARWAVIKAAQKKTAKA